MGQEDKLHEGRDVFAKNVKPKKSKWKWLRRLEQKSKSNPMAFSLILISIGCVLFIMGMGIYEQKKGLAEGNRLYSTESGKISQIQTWVKEKKLESIQEAKIIYGDLFNVKDASFVIFTKKSNIEKTKKGEELNKDNKTSSAVNRIIENKENTVRIPLGIYQNVEFQKDLLVYSKENDLNYLEPIKITRSSFFDLIGFLLFYIVIIVLIVLLQIYMTGMMVSRKFSGQISNEEITFKDVIGYQEVKEQFQEVLSQLKNPGAYQQQGMKAPRGLLLTGSPGVGKTMFAKALANEIGANFLYATGADFVEMFVGVGSKRVRELFLEAKLASPSIIFIDEIDALGSRESNGMMDSERLSTINQMLAQMDGFIESEQVLVVGATNYIDKLDPALLRPGRFDKKIYIPLPDTETREGILAYYLKDVQLSEDVNLHDLALKSAGMSGADLKNWCSETKQIALREKVNSGQIEEINRASMKDKLVIKSHDFIKAQEQILLGVVSTKPNKEDLVRVAVHELGHALMNRVFLQKEVIVEKISVGAKGSALGFTLSRPRKESTLQTEKQLKGQLRVLLGGRAAEEIMLGDVSTGAGDDLKRAHQIAYQMITNFGMGPSHGLSVVSKEVYGLTQVPVSVQQDIKHLLDEAYEDAKEVISIAQEKIKEGTFELLKTNILLEDQISQLFEDVIKHKLNKFSENKINNLFLNE